MKCSFCGNELPNGASFCPECGTILNLDNEFVAPRSAAPSAPTIPDAPQPQPTAPPTQPQTPPDEMFAVPVYVSPYAAPELAAQAAYVPKQQPPRAEEPFEPTEIQPQEEDADDADDMYLAQDEKKRGKAWVAAVVVLLIAGVAAYGVKTYVLDQKPRPTSSPTTSPTASLALDESTTDDIFWTTTTEPADDSDASDEDDKTQTSEDPDLSAITADTDDPEDLSDLHELTAPDVYEQSDASTTEAPVTRETTTAPRTTAPTTRQATTTRAQTTTRAATTTTRPQTTTAAVTTVQRPASTTPRRTQYVTANGVALRTAPRQNAASLLSLSIGADVVVTGEENGYCYVYSNRYGVSGWVSKRYIANARPVAAAEQSVSGVVAPDVTYSNPATKTVASGGSSLRLRKGPGTSYDVIRSITDGYPVSVKGKSSSVSGWVYVTDITRGVSGWVSAAYLQ